MQTRTQLAPAVRELFEGKNFPHMATLMPDGSPQVTPVWVDIDDAGHILVNSSEGRAKPRNVRRDPRVAISVHDQENPYRSAFIRGRVGGEARGRRGPYSQAREEVHGRGALPELAAGRAARHLGNRTGVRVRDERVGAHTSLTTHQTTEDRAGHGGEIISERLQQLLEEMLAGRAPNAGRFCGNCYHPLGPERDACPHCGAPVSARPPVEKVPREVIEAHRVRRSREGNVVRAIAWGGLTLGVVLALVPLAFAGVRWWSITLFFVFMFGFYIASANLANSVGDAWGYRWGQSTFRRRWEAFVAKRDSTPD